MPDHILIFSLPRCGSTTLMRVLNCHKEIHCASEPFNDDSPPFAELVRAEDPQSLEAKLEAIRAEHDCIKHVWHPSGWPFPKRSDLNRALLLRPDHKVVFLNRRNILRRIVSNQMSMQTKLWALWREGDGDSIETFEFQEINEKAVKWQLRRERKLIKAHRRDLTKNKTVFLDLWYEDVFDPALTTEDRRQAIGRIVDFMGRDTSPEAMDLDEVNRLLDPSSTKMNARDTYLRVPNIHKIEKRFGSDKTGWLFK